MSERFSGFMSNPSGYMRFAMVRQRLSDALMVVWCLLLIWSAIDSQSHSAKGQAGHPVTSLLQLECLML